MTWVRAVPAAVGSAYAALSEVQLARIPASGILLQLLRQSQAHLEDKLDRAGYLEARAGQGTRTTTPMQSRTR